MTCKFLPSDAAFRLYHITTSGLNLTIIFEFSAAMLLLRCGHFRHATLFSAAFVTIMSAHECINFNPDRKSVTKNGFSDTDFLFGSLWHGDAAFDLIWRFFTAYVLFRPYFYFRFKICSI